VPAQTAGHVNEWIRRRTEANVSRYAAAGEAIDRRLEELDRGGGTGTSLNHADGWALWAAMRVVAATGNRPATVAPIRAERLWGVHPVNPI
jgi:hypothetical protein